MSNHTSPYCPSVNPSIRDTVLDKCPNTPKICKVLHPIFNPSTNNLR